MLPLVLVLLLPALVSRTMAKPTNVTVDDFDRTRIAYAPLNAWQSTSDGSTEDRFMKTTTFTRTQGASAAFDFSGASAIYFGGFGEIDDVPGTFEVELDGTTKTVSGNINPKNDSQQILFAKKDLDPNKNYTITVRKSSVTGSHDLNVDFFTYTVPDPVTTPDPNQNIQGAPVAAIAGGIVAGVVVIALIAVIVFLAMRRKRRATASKGEPKVDLNGGQPHAPIIGGGNLMSPNGPRYSDYMPTALGDRPPVGEIYQDPYANGRQQSFDQSRPGLGSYVSSSSPPESQHPISHSDQPYHSNAQAPPVVPGVTQKQRYGHGQVQSQGAFYNPTVSGAASFNPVTAPSTTSGQGSVNFSHSRSDSASHSGPGTEFSGNDPLSPIPPPYESSGAAQQPTSLFPPRKS